VEGGKERDEGKKGREGRLRERLTGEKESVLLCVTDCVVWIYVVIVTFLFVIISTLLPMKTLYDHKH